MGAEMICNELAEGGNAWRGAGASGSRAGEPWRLLGKVFTDEEKAAD